MDQILKTVLSLKSTVKGLALATGLLIICFLAASTYVYVENHASKQAICALRGDLEQRVSASKNFVKEHPDKLKRLGITVAQVEHETENQQRTIDALSVVSCD